GSAGHRPARGGRKGGRHKTAFIAFLADQPPQLWPAAMASPLWRRRGLKSGSDTRSVYKTHSQHQGPEATPAPIAPVAHAGGSSTLEESGSFWDRRQEVPQTA